MARATLNVDRDAIRNLSNRFGVEWLDGEGVDLRKGDTEVHVNLHADGQILLRNLGLRLTINSIAVNRDGLHVDISPEE